MNELVVSLGGGQTIKVTRAGRTVVLENAGRRRQRLTVAEAWRLAEALDDVASAEETRKP